MMDEEVKTQIFDIEIAHLLRKKRKIKNWTVAELATRSGVSQAMISKVERGKSSPSATILSRLTSALGITLSKLFAELESNQTSPVRFADQQQHWTDSLTGITRWTLSPAGAQQELLKIEMPALGQLVLPSTAHEHLIGQTLWLLSGQLNFQLDKEVYHLKKGDCLALNNPQNCQLNNPDTIQPCVYIIAFCQKQ